MYLVNILYILSFTILRVTYTFYHLLYFDYICFEDACVKKELDLIALLAVKCLLFVLIIGRPDDVLKNKSK